MKNAKIYAIVVAFAMLAVGCVAYMEYPSDAAVTADGTAEYKFFIANGTDTSVTTWDVYTAEGYNAFDALAVALVNAEVDYDADEDYTVTAGTAPYQYLTINEDYGTINEINGIGGDSGCSWHIFMYSTIQAAWVAGPVDALGFYQAYNDYDASLRAANFIIYYSDSASIDARFTLPTTGLYGLADVTSDDVFEVKFTISIQSGLSKPDDVTEAQWSYLQNHTGVYYGYGSNAYLALKNAISNVTGNNEMYDTLDDQINTGSYGYVSSMLNVSECSSVESVSEEVEEGTQRTVTSTWDYWAVYTVADGVSSYGNFTLGFMSPITDFDGTYDFDEINLVYSESVYQYSYVEGSE